MQQWRRGGGAIFWLGDSDEVSEATESPSARQILDLIKADDVVAASIGDEIFFLKIERYNFFYLNNHSDHFTSNKIGAIFWHILAYTTVVCW